MRNVNYGTPPADTVKPVRDLTGKDARWVNRAVGLAMSSNHNFPMGAVGVAGGSLLGHATNRHRNSPRIAEWTECSVHAEAALAARADLHDATVYVARVLADGKAAMAKPCRNCLQTLTASGARRVVWTENDDRAGWLSLG